jgi:hypothetical protein
MSHQRSLARIFQPPKSAMQSGRGKTHAWVLEYAPSEAKVIDPLTGWVGSGDTRRQIHLHFETREQALAYAEAQGIPYEVEAGAAPVTMKPKIYADNFRYGRHENWSH